MERGAKKVNRRIANKQKMSQLEWTDEAIESFSNIDLTEKVSSDHANEVINDDMEAKIARVQLRKREAAERLARQKLLPPAPPRVSVLSYSRESKSSEGDTGGARLADSLNGHFSTYLSQNPQIVSNLEANFPLEYYDSSTFNEQLCISKADLPMAGVVLLADHGPESSAADSLTPSHPHTPTPSHPHRGLGTWRACTVVDVDGAAESVTVELASLLEERHVVALMRVCLVSQDAERYAERVVDALMRRQQILFDANMLSVTNTGFLGSLRLPSCALVPYKTVPVLGLVAVPGHDMKARVAYHQSHSYLYR
ncbi:hypothetical protein B484DRAFT_432393 [Ochromonadaceae sp. CCMP2298]|nr:hypothetical protein B484DRAFT_432393 [Ochromonadaceae sp. CCMP2298]